MNGDFGSLAGLAILWIAIFLTTCGGAADIMRAANCADCICEQAKEKK